MHLGLPTLTTDRKMATRRSFWVVVVGIVVLIAFLVIAHMVTSRERRG